MIPRGSCSAPALPGLPILKNLLQFRRDQIGTLEAAYRACGPVSQLTLAYERVVFVNEPSLVRRVLVDNAGAYRRCGNFEEPWLKLFLGDGLLTTDGALWRRLRRASQPAFTKTAVARVSERMRAATTQVLSGWEEALAHGGVVDLFPELVALNATIAYQAFFGLDLDRRDALAVAQGLFRGQEFVVRRVKIPLPLLARLPTPWNVAFRRGMRRVEAQVDRAIKDRLERPRPEADDMLGVLLARLAPDDPGLLREQVLTNFTAAPENTATLLTWTLYLLSRHASVARDVIAEAEAGGPPTLLRRVLSETLRLYPGAPYFDRRAVEDDELGGHRIPRGSLVIVSPYVLHRSEPYWERPLEFDPDRFKDPALAASPAYIPFGLGPRRCIGDRFALTLAETVLPELLRRFELRRPDTAPLEAAPLINLRPRGGFRVSLRPRTQVRLTPSACASPP